MIICLIRPVLLIWTGIGVLTLLTGLLVSRQSRTVFIPDSSTLVVKLSMPSPSHGLPGSSCFAPYGRWSRRRTLLVPEWHSAPWWPLLVTKHGTWRWFVSDSLRIQTYDDFFFPGEAASCVFTTGAPAFGLLALKLCFCGSHVLS